MCFMSKKKGLKRKEDKAKYKHSGVPDESPLNLVARAFSCFSSATELPPAMVTADCKAIVNG
jgi:hypothetical protein